MDLRELVTAERVSLARDVASKKRALERLSGLLATGPDGLNAVEIFDGLFGRERLGSTGLGHGVALPHTRSKRIHEAVGAILRLQVGVDFDSLDRQPVDLLFGLLVPDHAPERHLQTLAQLAEMFRDPKLCAALRAAETPDALFELLVDWTPGGTDR